MELIQEARDAYAGWMAAIDKRVVSWPLMANPWPTLAICLTYCIAAYTLPKMLKGQGSDQLKQLKHFSQEKILILGSRNHVGREGVQLVHGRHEFLHRQRAPPELGGVRQELAVRSPCVWRGRQTDGGCRGDLVVLHLQVAGNAGTVRQSMI